MSRVLERDELNSPLAQGDPEYGPSTEAGSPECHLRMIFTRWKITYLHSRIFSVASEVIAKIIKYFLALADMMVQLGIARRFINLCTRGLLLSALLDATYSCLTALDLRQLANEGFPISATVSAFRGTMFQFSLVIVELKQGGGGANDNLLVQCYMSPLFQNDGLRPHNPQAHEICKFEN